MVRIKLKKNYSPFVKIFWNGFKNAEKDEILK